MDQAVHVNKAGQLVRDSREGWRPQLTGLLAQIQDFVKCAISGLSVTPVWLAPWESVTLCLIDDLPTSLFQSVQELCVWKPCYKYILILAFPTLCLQNYLPKIANRLINLPLRASAVSREPVGCSLNILEMNRRFL